MDGDINLPEEVFLNIGFSFFATGILLGIGLAMDAFSVSLANGLNEVTMKPQRMCKIAGVFALFQFMMPLIGWFLVSTAARIFGVLEPVIPWISFLLLAYIGGKMLYDSIRGQEEESHASVLGLKALLVQGVATSIDALSVGFTVASYTWQQTLIICALIGGVTFLICYAGLEIGKQAGTKLAGKAGAFGGVLLIAIGVKIFVAGV